MVAKHIPYVNPEGYLFLDQKRRLHAAKRIKSQMKNYGLSAADIGFATA